MKISIFIIISLVVMKITSARKPKTIQWTQNYNFEEPSNWNPQRVPCASDRIDYTFATTEAVRLTQKNIAVSGIVLAMDGSLHLQNDGVVTLTGGGKNDFDCPGGDVVFKETSYVKERWIWPHNWQVMTNEEEENFATPHLDLLPCQDDYVVFNKSLSYSVILPKTDVYVRGISDGNTMLNTTEQWQNEVNNNAWYYEAQDTGSVLINSEELECSSREACPCQGAAVKDEFCLEVTPTCEKSKCLEPVLPINNCCTICGGVIQMNVPLNFHVGRLKEEISKLIDDWGVKKIEWYVGSVGTDDDTNHIQIVVVDDNDEYEGNSVDFVQELRKYLTQKKSLKTTLHVSGLPLYDSKGGWEALIMFFVVGIFFIGLLMYYYSPSAILNTPPFRPLGFARFENRSREGSLVLGVSQVSLNKAFDNPMYDKAAARSSFNDEDLKEEPLNGSETEEESVEAEKN